MSADQWELKTQHKLHCHESGEDLDLVGVRCCQPEGWEGARCRRRRAVACRQTEVTEVSPQVPPLSWKHTQSVPSPWQHVSTEGGILANGFRSTDDTFSMNEVLDGVESVKISRAFAAEYLAFHGLIFFFDALWIIMICWDRKTSTPPTALFIFLTFGTLRPQNSVFKGVRVLWSPDSCRMLPQFPLTLDYLCFVGKTSSQWYVGALKQHSGWLWTGNRKGLVENPSGECWRLQQNQSRSDGTGRRHSRGSTTRCIA